MDSGWKWKRRGRPTSTAPTKPARRSAPRPTRATHDGAYTVLMSKIIVSGSVAYDRIMDYPGLFADHILADKTHTINLSFQVEKLSVEFGGTAGNVAYSLALMGESPEIIATVGNDFNQY